MNRDLKNIDKLFHENLSAAGDQPPMHVWQGVEEALDSAAEQKNTRNEKRKRRLAFAAFFIVAAGVATWLWTANDEGDNGSTTATITTTLPGTPGQQVIKAQQPVLPSLVSAERNTTQPKPKENIVGPAAPHHPIQTSKTNKGSDDRLETGDAQPVTDAVVVSSGAGDKDDLPVRIVSASADSLAGAALHHGDINTGATLQSIEHGFADRSITGAGDSLQTAPTAVVTGQLKDGADKADAATKAAPVVRVKKPGKFSVTLFFAPDITTRNLEQNFGTFRDERKEELMRTEKNSEFDFTLGARVEYKLGKHFSLQSGISFSTNTIDIAKKTIFARVDDRDGSLKFRFNFSSGYAFFKPKTIAPPQFFGDSAQALSSTSTLHYINIPLALKYYIPLGKRFSLSAQAGIAARFITRQNIDAVYASNGFNEKGKTNEIQGLKTTYFNGVVGIGADYSFNNRIAFTVFPSFNFATTSINRDAPVKAYPNTLSLAAGMKFQL
ncbi:outer membrane beta-barrel protein [Sediminibacterium roseum]|uniref:Outer membrane beta-barrel protein n=1 Tax=Sediminibacterium roseum TaxID=1978412 RepID=A0ABW9ZWH1_9BACT|nr:outer membrane beta-barrel protein [Sediminibacterium roseum]NCI51494.1 outer membrane beta-barrel protein [Sediminibacterium roseum]